MTHTLIIMSSNGSMHTPVKTKEDGEKIKNKLLKHLRTKKDPVFEFTYDGDSCAVVVNNLSCIFVQPDEKYRQFVYNQRRDVMFMNNSIQNEINGEHDLVYDAYKQETSTLNVINERLCELMLWVNTSDMPEKTRQHIDSQIQHMFDILTGDEIK